MKRFARRLLPTLALCAAPAAAYDLPAVNLGFTSFLDGGPPAGPGHYFTEYLQYYTSDDFKGAAPPGSKVDVSIALTQYIYQSNQPVLFGGKWGLNLMLPLVGFDSSDTFGFLNDNGTGFGDVLVGPYVQWDPVMGANGPLFMHRIELQTIWPTGKYDQNKALNLGSNHWSFNPYWAGTLFLGPRVTASWRLHYLWNGTNDEPFVGLGASSVRPGQAVHANFSAAYMVIPKQLRIGINGYYLDQTTDTKIDGVKHPERDERVFAIGPGLIWHLSRDAHFFVNAFFESGARNRPEGERYNIRFVYHF